MTFCSLRSRVPKKVKVVVRVMKSSVSLFTHNLKHQNTKAKNIWFY
ncbi:unnamed protein product, partial [Vitis vinifera]